METRPTSDTARKTACGLRRTVSADSRERVSLITSSETKEEFCPMKKESKVKIIKRLASLFRLLGVCWREAGTKTQDAEVMLNIDDVIAARLRDELKRRGRDDLAEGVTIFHSHLAPFGAIGRMNGEREDILRDLISKCYKDGRVAQAQGAIMLGDALRARFSLTKYDYDNYVRQ